MVEFCGALAGLIAGKPAPTGFPSFTEDHCGQRCGQNIQQHRRLTHLYSNLLPPHLKDTPTVSLRALVVAALFLLAGCATSARAPVTAVQAVVVSPATWQQIDREIVSASQQATEQVKLFARGSMEHWRTRVYQQTEENFIPWFSSYWTQEWLSMKVSWYSISAGDEQDALGQAPGDVSA